jgi:hypothetical protein
VDWVIREPVATKLVDMPANMVALEVAVMEATIVAVGERTTASSNSIRARLEGSQQWRWILSFGTRSSPVIGEGTKSTGRALARGSFSLHLLS